MKDFCFRFIAEEGIKVEFVQATPTEVVFKVSRDDAKSDETAPIKKENSRSFVEMWNAGCSIAEIADEFKISRATVYRWVKKTPECIPHTKKPTVKKKSIKHVTVKPLLPDKLTGKVERFVQMWNDCIPIAEIANEFGVHLATIHRWANKIPECISPEEKAQKRAAKNQVTPNVADDTTSTPTAEAIPNHQNTSASENWPKSGERLHKNEVAALCKMWENGQHNITELARYFNVSRNTIYYQLRVNGCRK